MIQKDLLNNSARSRFIIFYHIFEYIIHCSDHKKRINRILQTVNIAHHQWKIYKEYMINNNYIIEADNWFTVTKKGIKYCNAVKQLTKIIENDEL